MSSLLIFAAACVALSLGVSAAAIRPDRPPADDQRASIAAGQLEAIAGWVDEQLHAQNADGHWIAACAATAAVRVAGGLKPAQAGRVYRSRPAWIRQHINAGTHLARLLSLQSRKAN